MIGSWQGFSTSAPDRSASADATFPSGCFSIRISRVVRHTVLPSGSCPEGIWSSKDRMPPFDSLEMSRRAAFTFHCSIRRLKILAFFSVLVAWLVGGDRCL